MRLAIMQPYFLPYIGYFQLIAAVDLFVVYDRIKYTKKGWINRNRMLVNGADAMFSLPLKKDHDALDVVDRTLAADFDRTRLCQQIRGAYGRAPCFADTFALVEQIVHHPDNNLFRYIHHSLLALCRHLGIATEIRVSSTVEIPEDAKGQDKVLGLCNALGASTYRNSIGGLELYNAQDFQRAGVTLQFIRARPWEYAQFGQPFVPWLSILDVLMFNPLEQVRERIRSGFDLVEGPV
jgi:WbqC-like protein family